MRKPSGIVLELDKYFHGEEKNWEVDYLAKLRFEELNTGEEVVGACDSIKRRRGYSTDRVTFTTGRGA